jgi:hypothetical protein
MSRLAGITAVGVAMPAKKGSVTDAERAKRILDAARDHETSNDPISFERAFAAVVKAPKKPKGLKAKTKSKRVKTKKAPPEGPRPIGVLAISKRPF